MCIRDRYKSIEEILNSTSVADISAVRTKQKEEIMAKKQRKIAEPLVNFMTPEQRDELIEQLITEMKKAAKELNFELAADLRDEIENLKVQQTIAEEKSK